MADAVNNQGGPATEEVAYKLLYLVAWGENKDLEAWGKADRKWLLDTYAECCSPSEILPPGWRRQRLRRGCAAKVMSATRERLWRGAGGFGAGQMYRIVDAA